MLAKNTNKEARMTEDELTKIAEKVSMLMQLDRQRHHVGTEVDLKVQANLPAYIASVFEEAGRVSPDLTPAAYYDHVNKRISEVQAQLYLMRVELENRHGRDPAAIYTDPLAISAYGVRMKEISRQTKTFDFEAAILSYGWYATEHSEDRYHRWMRPGEVSVACVPHLGPINQTLEIAGYVLHPDQLADLRITAGDQTAKISKVSGSQQHFIARLKLSGADLRDANHIAVEFHLNDFRQPNEADTRLLGANVGRFSLTSDIGTAS